MVDSCGLSLRWCCWPWCRWRWCLCWSCDGRRRTADARPAPSIYSPTMGETGGFRVSSAPSNETIIPYRYWLIEGQVSEIDYDIVPGRRMSLRTARTGQMLYPVGFLTWHLRMYSSTTLTVSP